MIPRDVFYIPPKLRIETDAKWPPHQCDPIGDYSIEVQRTAEAQRIWPFVKGSAEASNISTRVPE